MACLFSWNGETVNKMFSPPAQSIDFAGKAILRGMGRPPHKPHFFPNRLRATRLARKKSLADIAEVTGKSLSSIQRYETGQYQLKLADARILAHALDVDVAEIIGEQTPEQAAREAELLKLFRALGADGQAQLLKIARALSPESGEVIAGPPSKNT